MNKYELAKKITQIEGLTNEEKASLVELLRSQRQMLELVRRPDEIEAIKNNSQEFDKVRKAYDWESIGEKTSSLYSGEY